SKGTGGQDIQPALPAPIRDGTVLITIPATYISSGGKETLVWVPQPYEQVKRKFDESTAAVRTPAPTGAQQFEFSTYKLESGRTMAAVMSVNHFHIFWNDADPREVDVAKTKSTGTFIVLTQLNGG